MDRIKFIKTCGGACLGALGFGMLSIGCTSTKMVSAPLEKDQLLVPVSEFELEKKGGTGHHPYLILRNTALAFPVYVYRFADGAFKALLMRCTHQGTELQAFGDKLQCPAHGSVFDNQGEVTNGPASHNLREFPVTVDDQLLKISLK